jgi:HAD superfamily hydrolase (TIGR01549 family)
MADTAVFDIDGTLVDTNYHHAVAWYRALLRHEIVVPVWRIHRAIGMGGDLLVAHVAGDEAEDRHGDSIRARWEKEFDQIIGEIRPFDGAHELLADVKARGFRVVLASSGKQKHVETFLDLVEGDSVADAWTSGDDVEKSKPAADLVKGAIEKVGGGDAVMIGDSPWDCEAAGRTGVPTIGVLTGGYSAQELRDAGAIQVFTSLVDLRHGLDDTVLAAAT